MLNIVMYQNVTDSCYG